jgi:hypothetical protein
MVTAHEPVMNMNMVTVDMVVKAERCVDATHETAMMAVAMWVDVLFLTLLVTQDARRNAVKMIMMPLASVKPSV